MPWVPQSVLDRLLTAVDTLTAAAAVSGREPLLETAKVNAPATPSDLGSTPSPAATDVIALPPAVADACIFYAFDDQDERAANFRRAEALIRAGKSPKEVVQHIKMGAHIEELFI